MKYHVTCRKSFNGRQTLIPSQYLWLVAFHFIFIIFDQEKEEKIMEAKSSYEAWTNNKQESFHKKISKKKEEEERIKKEEEKKQEKKRDAELVMSTLFNIFTYIDTILNGVKFLSFTIPANVVPWKFEKMFCSNLKSYEYSQFDWF